MPAGYICDDPHAVVGVRRAASHEVRICGVDMMGEGVIGEVRGEPRGAAESWLIFCSAVN